MFRLGGRGRAPLPCAVQGLRLFAVLASPAAAVDSTINILRPYSHAQCVFRFQTVDETAACGRFWLCDLEGDFDIEQFGGSLGSMLGAAVRFAYSVADSSGECTGYPSCYVRRALCW